MLSVSAITLIDAVSVDSGFPARHILGNPAPLQGAGAEHFVLAEGFESEGEHAGDGNREIGRASCRERVWRYV